MRQTKPRGWLIGFHGPGRSASTRAGNSRSKIGAGGITAFRRGRAKPVFEES